MNPTKLFRQRIWTAVLAIAGALLALPAAATLTIAGVVCASATASTDANGNVTVSCSTATTAAPTISGSPLTQTGTAGTAISAITLSNYVSGVQGTATYALQAGSTLPGNLSLNNGVISGTPAAAGNATIYWTVTGSNGSATGQINFNIAAVAASPPPPSPPPSPSPPPANTCANTNGAAWTNFNSPGLSVSGTLVGGGAASTSSYAFVMNKGTFPYGASILINVSGSYSNNRANFISECPGDTTIPTGTGNSAATCQRMNARAPNFTLGYADDASTQIDGTTCNLVAGKTYYLNLRTIYSALTGQYITSGYLLNSSTISR